jgi:pseudaminic acid synthase
MPPTIQIDGHQIGPGHPTYIIAEMSGNHNQDFEQSLRIIKAAHEAGADAVKIQTYTPDTITIPCDNEYFKIGGTLWDGRTLYDLYAEAYTPWEWQPKLKAYANELGLALFSSPFDHTAVEFLSKMDVPAYKIASFENVDLPLLRAVAKTGKPVIVSTGMATLAEIDEAVQTLTDAGAQEVALLKCVSAYPARPDDMHLRTIPHLAQAFDVPVGLSDHTLDSAVAVAAVALGACIVEKHLTIDRRGGGPDSAFSLEPGEFKAMVQAIRTAERAIGRVHYGVTAEEEKSKIFRRSLFAVRDISAGEMFTTENVRSIRPGHGLHTRYLPLLLGTFATRDIARGMPITLDMSGHVSGEH